MDLGQAADVGQVNDLGILPKPLPFGKYYLLEKINTGGMAEVFKAKAFGVEGFERILALKRILPSIAEDEEFISMFIDEAKIAGQLNHANIAQIFDLGKVGDHYFIALEYIPGRDLRAIFDRAVKLGEKLSIAQVCYVTMKLCEGLDYAHNKRDAQGHELGIVHRDISPQNVLISFEGESKLIDFGIAKAHGKSSSTQVGILKGKFSYMSPEQVRGGKIDRRSDIFSLGIVLYELLTLERLFLGSSDFSTLEKIRKVEFSPPTLFNPHIPQELEDIVLKSLARDPADRYQSSHEMQDALQKFMFNQGLYYTNKDLASYMKSAFATEISLEQKKLEYYRTLKKDDLERANPDAADDLSWDEEEDATNVFDRAVKAKEDILAELDNIELPVGDGIAYAKPKANGAGANGANGNGSIERFKAELPPPRATASLAAVGGGNLLDDVSPQSAYPLPRERRSKAPIVAGIIILILGLGAVVAWLMLKPKVEYGTVQFDIDPAVPVTLIIDDELITENGAQMPPIGLEQVIAGENHSYVIRAEGFNEAAGTFVVEPNKRSPIKVSLVSDSLPTGGTGFALMVTPTDATVSVDGVVLEGSSPFSRTDLTPGNHTIEISAEGYRTETKQVNVLENTLVQLEAVVLNPAEIALTLQSEPDGAAYIIKDKTTGKEVRRGTTMDIIKSLPNDHVFELQLTKTGYESKTKTWTPPEGKSTDTELVVLSQTRAADVSNGGSRPSSGGSRTSSGGSRTSSGGSRTSSGGSRTSSGGSTSDSSGSGGSKTSGDKTDKKNDTGGSSGGTTASKAPGIIKVASKPPADVIINGKNYGKTPKKITLPAGTYTVKFVHPDKGEEVQRVKVIAGKEQKLINKYK